MPDVSFGRRLKAQPGLLGSWCTFASFASTEVMTHLGFDFLVLDLQHCEITQSHFPSLLGAFGQGGPYAVVRAAQNDYHLINWLFDQGVSAVMVPMVNSAAGARQAVDAAKFPPLGQRSFGPYRAASYSFGVPAYMADADQRATLIVQVESADAARNVGEILEVPGIDAVFIGPNDLAFSMRREGETFFDPSTGGDTNEGARQWTSFARTPEVLALCDNVLREAQHAGVPFGMTAGSIEEATEWFNKGASFMTLGSDFLFLRAGAKQTLEKP